MIPVRIFIIDDSAVIRTIIERVLETSRECIVVGRSSSADEGRTAIARLRPDAITLDISMPGVDGLHYLEELRPVLHPAMVIVSASTTTGSVAEGRSAGARRRRLLRQIADRLGRGRLRGHA